MTFADYDERPANQRWHREEFAREPAIDVSWYQAKQYAEWVGGRLPTAAEWERACRSTEGNTYPWGDELPEVGRANYYSISRVLPVGSFPPDANGLDDMAGNANEWVSSPPDDYPYKVNDNRENLDAEGARVLRGGSWTENELGVRCAYRMAERLVFFKKKNTALLRCRYT